MNVPFDGRYCGRHGIIGSTAKMLEIKETMKILKVHIVIGSVYFLSCLLETNQMYVRTMVGTPKPRMREYSHKDDTLEWDRNDTIDESAEIDELHTFDEVTLPSRHKFLGARRSGMMNILDTMCGIDNAPHSYNGKEGNTTIEWYPWLGVLAYPHGDERLITAVVLVSSSLVIASALDIDKLPKVDFRDKARVILGRNCTGAEIGVADYSLHTDYMKNTFSALAIIQLELELIDQEIHPICPPPKAFTESKFYAVTISDDCSKSQVKVYEMYFVPTEECRQFYRKSGLDVATIWPKHVACGKAKRGGRCIWRNGATLAVKQDGRWHLLGVGVYGPGCEAPSRFIDYSQYADWVNTNVARLGRPAVTRIDQNYIILRRARTKIQRFGPCDTEEMKSEIFTDTTEVKASDPDINKHTYGRVRYNITIHSNVDYHCITFRAWHNPSNQDPGKPRIALNRYCLSPTPICYSSALLKIDFYVEIFYYRDIKFKVGVYGREWSQIDAKGLIKYYNNKQPKARIPHDIYERAGIIPLPY